MHVALKTPILNRNGTPNPAPLDTVGALLLQVIDTPVASDATAGLDRRIALARLARAIVLAGDEIEINTGDAVSILDRAAEQLMSSILFEYIVDAVDPARWRA